MINSVDPDETARYEPSHLDLHCLQRYLYWSAGLRESNLYWTIGPNRDPDGTITVQYRFRQNVSFDDPSQVDVAT